MDVSGLGIAADQTREAHVNGKRIAVQRQDRVAGRGGTSGRGLGAVYTTADCACVTHEFLSENIERRIATR